MGECHGAFDPSLIGFARFVNPRWQHEAGKRAEAGGQGLWG